MKALVVHNSDEVKCVFVGVTEQEILDKLKGSLYWEDIVSRICDEDEDSFKEEEINISDHIDGYLVHDGDSEDGYTLLEVI